MSRSTDIGSVLSIRYTLAAGAIVRVGSFPGQEAVTIKLISGGTLEIGNFGDNPSNPGYTLLAGAASVSSGQTFGQMYYLSANEAFSANANGGLYFYASGATCVVTVANGRSVGV